jgi:hypothetical protein
VSQERVSIDRVLALVERIKANAEARNSKKVKA